MNKPPLESTIVKKVMTMIRTRGGWCAKIHGGPFQTRGIPDILACYRGLFIGFEVKRDSSKLPTALQLAEIEGIRRAGGIALPIHSVKMAEAMLDRIDEELGGPVPDQS